MAHFAKLDENNVVTDVVVVGNKQTRDADGVEREEIGVEFCRRLFGGGSWKQTSYNASFRKNYAGIGFTYDPSMDAFIPPKPYESWILESETAKWVPPIPKPDDHCDCWYEWDEATVSWVEPVDNDGDE